MSELRLRPAVSADRDFARPIYIATTKPYVVHLPSWTDAYIAARFEGRFVLETTRMVEIGGVTVGWLRLSDAGDHVTLEQIYVDPARHGQNIGSRVMRLLLDECRARPVHLAVLKTNPARRLYDRFGFRVVEENETSYLMRRDPAP